MDTTLNARKHSEISRPIWHYHFIPKLYHTIIRAVKDKRNFHIEINMLNAALRATNIIISNEPVQDTTIPVYIHHSDEMYNWTYRRSKYYYDHIIENVVTCPTAERYWENILGLRSDDNFLNKSYVCK